MECSTPDFSVLHYLPEFAQTHVYWVGDAIQPSSPLSSASPPAFNLSQHQGLFQCESSGRSTGASVSASVLPVNIQGWFPLGLTGLSSLLSKGFSRVFSITTCSFHQFASSQFYELLILNQRLYLDVVSESPDKWAPGPSVRTSAQRHFK